MSTPDPISPKDLIDIAKIYLADVPKGLYVRDPKTVGVINLNGKPVIELTIEDSNHDSAVHKADGIAAAICMLLNNRE